MLDDLRKSTQEDDLLPFEQDDEEAGFTEKRTETRLFLGMTPVERMFLSFFLFMNVTVIGLALLLATGRIG